MNKEKTESCRRETTLSVAPIELAPQFHKRRNLIKELKAECAIREPKYSGN